MAALVAVLVGVGALKAAPTAHAWWDDVQLDRELRRAEAEIRRMQPAIDLLNAAVLPADLQPCVDSTMPNVSSFGFCWDGPDEVLPTTVAVAAWLRGLGLEAVDPRCVQARRQGVLCEVSGRLLGWSLVLELRPQISKTASGYELHDVTVMGDLGRPGEWAMVIPLPDGPPVAVPGEHARG